MYFGEPTGAAMPLCWAHAEYIKLLRSARDGQVFDRVPEVAERYLGKRKPGPSLEIWKRNRQPLTVHAGQTLRVLMAEPFSLHWSSDDWQTIQDTASSATEVGIHFVDVPIDAAQRVPVRFTFFWLSNAQWEGQDYEVGVAA